MWRDKPYASLCRVHISSPPPADLLLFFFKDTAPTAIYTLSLHDALPISPGDRERALAGARHRPERADREGRQPLRREARAPRLQPRRGARAAPEGGLPGRGDRHREDRKSTRLNSSHQIISYAVFCLKKKK